MRTRVLIALAFIVSSGTLPLLAQPDTPALEIQLARSDDAEQQAREQLLRLVAQYDVTPWLFTRAIRIEAGATPHSHPVLTLNTRHAEDDALLLSTFLHEELHWWLDRQGRDTAAAVADLRKRFPEVPVGAPEAADTVRSTYELLLVGWLEYDADRTLLGAPEARRVLKFWSGDHDRWIYRTVLEREHDIGIIVRAHQLLVQPARMRAPDLRPFAVPVRLIEPVLPGPVKLSNARFVMEPADNRATLECTVENRTGEPVAPYWITIQVRTVGGGGSSASRGMLFALDNTDIPPGRRARVRFVDSNAHEHFRFADDPRDRQIVAGVWRVRLHDGGSWEDEEIGETIQHLANPSSLALAKVEVLTSPPAAPVQIVAPRVYLDLQRNRATMKFTVRNLTDRAIAPGDVEVFIAAHAQPRAISRYYRVRAEGRTATIAAGGQARAMWTIAPITDLFTADDATTGVAFIALSKVTTPGAAFEDAAMFDRVLGAAISAPRLRP